MHRKNGILLIEDDRIDAMTVSRAFKELGIPDELLLFKNGLEALNFLKKATKGTQYLILLDLNMPTMNGLEFIREIKQDQNLRKYPVIVLTTSNDSRDKRECFGLSVAGYFVKPANYDEFVTIIKIINDYWTMSKLPDHQFESN